MKINYIQGNIFKSNARALIIWGRTGLNEFCTLWHDYLLRLEKEQARVGDWAGHGIIWTWHDVALRSFRPWETEHSKVICINSPSSKPERYLYFLNNAEGQHGLDDGTLKRLLTEALDSLDELGIKRVAFNGVDSNIIDGRDDGDSRKKKGAEFSRIKLIVEIIEDWARGKEIDIKQVDLISMSDSFVHYASENVKIVEAVKLQRFYHVAQDEQGRIRSIEFCAEAENAEAAGRDGESLGEKFFDENWDDRGQYTHLLLSEDELKANQSMIKQALKTK